MKRILTLVVVMMLAVASVNMSQDISAKTITKSGMYSQDYNNMYPTKIIKINRKKLVIKCKLDYFKIKNGKIITNNYKTLKKNKYTFRLTNKTKYYSINKISRSEAIRRFKDYTSGCPGFKLFVRHRKVYKVQFYIA